MTKIMLNWVQVLEDRKFLTLKAGFPLNWNYLNMVFHELERWWIKFHCKIINYTQDKKFGNDNFVNYVNTLRTGDANLRFYITTVQDGWRKSVFLTRACFPCAIHLTFRHRASCILGKAFHYSPENAFYIFNQQIYFIIWYLLDRASLI